ncbi:MAG TPA: hypothetical protein VFE62_07105 [Gemmataceae bacterium]|nr:hypothetical protein [Gemmataceae bacterium]
METNRDDKKGANGKVVPTGCYMNGMSKPLFSLGNMAITSGALRTVDTDDVHAAIGRHRRGDWGDVGPEDWKENDDALKEGRRLLSSYKDRQGIKFWIITEYDRSLTTILLPDEY